MSRGKRIGVTAGCPCGIGPTVLVRALADARLNATPVYYGSAEALGRVGGAPIEMRPLPQPYLLGAWGEPGADDLACQRDALLAICAAAKAGDIDAIVTGPVRKSALVIDGEVFPGQTEIVARFAGDGSEPLMVFSGGPFVMGLCTVHVALKDVSAHVTRARVDRSLSLLDAAARRMSKKDKPAITVLGVNPHAGEGGLFGREEIDVLRPAIDAARWRGLDVRGPVAADGFFADVARSQNTGAPLPDAVLAMHHDQALAPYKLLVRGEGINVTWGASVVRTSPDHGTADGLAKDPIARGKASALSMLRALELADRLIS